MMKSLLLTFCLILFLPALAHSACPDGDYNVKGWNPGNPVSASPNYTGTATIKTVGETCHMSWAISAQKHGGVGFYDPSAKRLDISYAHLTQRWFGFVTYTYKDGAFHGKWNVYNPKSGKVGVEILTKR